MDKKIYYNSWDEAYRFPFGAIQKNGRVEISIEVTLPSVIAVSLLITKDEHWNQTEEVLLKNTQPNVYTGQYKLTKEAGLYFYHFKVSQNEGTHTRVYYYGAQEDGRGGEGQIYGEHDNVHEFQLTCFDKDVKAPEWYRNAVAYHIFVDRFANGEEDGKIRNPRKNTFIYATPEDSPYFIKDEKGDIVRWDFFGGNLKGIIEKIPYLKSLGVNVLYLSPIFQGRSNHKFDTADFYTIDSMFGDEAIFEEMVEKLHASGIHVILEGVFNHVGQDSLYFNRLGTYPEEGAYQSKESPYYPWFDFKDYPDDYNCWWGVKDLPVLNKNNKEVQDLIYSGEESVVSYWGKKGIDGWRLDLADELPTFFLEGIRQSMENINKETVLIGEVWEDASNKIAYGERRNYTEGNTLHSVMNYPFKDEIFSLLRQQTQPIDTYRVMMAMKENYPSHFFYNSFNNIGTHDTTRLATEFQGDIELINLAVGLLFTLPGVPCVYYGDEAGLTGIEDSTNRKFFPWGRENQEIMALYKKWIYARNTDTNLKEGEFVPFYSSSLFGFMRYCDQYNYSIVAVNPSKYKVNTKDEVIQTPNMPYKYVRIIQEIMENQKIKERGLMYIRKHE